MAEKTLLFDSDECLGCFACEVACKQEHGLGPGEQWIRIRKEEPVKSEGRWSMEFTARYCRHCDRPVCREVCPAGAVSQGPEGIVIFSEESCTGCKACIEACPFDALRYNAERGIVRACTLCRERTARGLEPACVHHCPTEALRYGIAVAEDRREKHGPG